jgi:flagellar basal-body rod modification protein FlgD
MASTVTNNTSNAAAADVYSKLNGDSSTTTTKTDNGTDRFLKLLVTQLQNQDPLNPMDNAQMTSQMAQISTVEGLNKVNTSIQSMSSQFMSLQAVQGANLVGRDVLIEGKDLKVADGKAEAAFELDGAADSVKVEVLSASGRVVDTIDLGAETSGKHGFSWTPPESVTNTEGLTFRIKATSGTNSVGATTLITDKVKAVNTSGNTLNLELQGGSTVAYSAVKAFS